MGEKTLQSLWGPWIGIHDSFGLHVLLKSFILKNTLFEI